MIGVLALQGGYAEHLAVLKLLGLEACEVRTREEMMNPKLRGLIIPGGESTVMVKFIDAYFLREAICARTQNPDFVIYGTCAGLILLAKEVPNLKGEPLGLLDVTVERNAYGRQLSSFITELDVKKSGNGNNSSDFACRAHFIRAPKITRVDEEVEVLSRYKGDPVLVRHNNIWGSTFHPELAGEIAIHKLIFG